MSALKDLTFVSLLASAPLLTLTTLATPSFVSPAYIFGLIYIYAKIFTIVALVGAASLALFIYTPSNQMNDYDYDAFDPPPMRYRGRAPPRRYIPPPMAPRRYVPPPMPIRRMPARMVPPPFPMARRARPRPPVKVMKV